MTLYCKLSACCRSVIVFFYCYHDRISANIAVVSSVIDGLCLRLASEAHGKLEVGYFVLLQHCIEINVDCGICSVI